MPVSLRCFGNALRPGSGTAASANHAGDHPAVSAPNTDSPLTSGSISRQRTGAEEPEPLPCATGRHQTPEAPRTAIPRNNTAVPTERTATAPSPTVSRLWPRLSLALAMIIVGSSVVTGKYVTVNLPLYASLWLRFCMASTVMVVILYWKEGGLPQCSLRDYGIMFAQAACGGFLFNTLLLEGLRYTDPATAGIITATGPACALLVSSIVLREPFTRNAALSVCLAASGIALLHMPAPQAGAAADVLHAFSFSDLAGSFPALLGTFLVIGAVMAESLFLLLGKRMQRPVSPLAVSTMLCVFGTVQFAPQGITELLSGGLGSFTHTAWLVLVWYALGITVGAYLLWFSGVAHVRGSEAGVYTGIMPLSAMFLAGLLLDTPIRWQHLAGCTAVLLGIAVATRRTRQKSESSANC